MKLNILSILETLFFPKPHDYLRQDHTNEHGRGLILIPVPNNSSLREKNIKEIKRRDIF